MVTKTVIVILIILSLVILNLALAHINYITGLVIAPLMYADAFAIIVIATWTMLRIEGTKV